MRLLLFPLFNHCFRILDVKIGRLKVIGREGKGEGRGHEGRDKNKGGKRVENNNNRETNNMSASGKTGESFVQVQNWVLNASINDRTSVNGERVSKSE